jgi:ADP-dependent NAD(P)H-hydrate dehydratase / NAD(P)H-hydrate epimerase
MAGGGYMVKLYSVKEMQALEKEANEKGLTYVMMMENAGKGIADEIEIAYSQLCNKKVIALVGSGNNGGDALVALYHLSLNKWETCAYIVKMRDPDDPLITHLMDSGGQVINVEEDKRYSHLKQLLESYSVLIDGIFGTGIKLPLKDDISSILKFVNTELEGNSKKIHIVAIDCPSGVDCDTGKAADETIPAEITVTMAGVKSGLIRFPAAKMTGEIRVASIGPIEELHSYKDNQKIILHRETIKNYLPERPLDAHKGTFGTAFIVAGSVNYTGAALLAGLAAYRSGAGLVTLAVPAPLHDPLSGQFPEATWVILPHELGVISADAARIVRQNINRATAILLGPGFGVEDTTREFLSKLFTEGVSTNQGEIGFIHGTKKNLEGNNIQKPIIMDADGLKLIAKIPNWSEVLPSPAILTPHPGEMSVLSGLSTDEIQADRLEIAKEFSKKWGHIVVLKGAFTVVAAPDGQLAVVPIATSALARAGTGDVLAGLIVGLRAQGIEAFQAACAGAWIHASAGLLAAKRMGNTASVIASDVLNAIPQVISDIQSI